MSDILQTSKQFTAGESVTHTGLNNIIGGTTFVTGVEKTADESTIIVDATGGYLKAGVMQEANIGDNQIKFKKIQKMGSPKVIGNLTGSNADPRAIDVDTVVDDTTGATDNSLSTTKAIKDYIDSEIAKNKKATANITTNGANILTFSAENTFEDYPFLDTSITPIQENSKFIISGMLSVGFVTTNKDYVAKVQYRNLAVDPDWKDFSLPSNVGNRQAGHFGLCTGSDNQNQVLAICYQITTSVISYSLGDNIEFKLVVCALDDATKALFINRSEDDNDTNDYQRLVSTLTVQES